MEKILIATPTSAVKGYVQEKWLSHINEFSYKNVTLCIVENSKDDGNAKAIAEYLQKINFKYPYYIKYHQPKPELRETILECSTLLRNFFLNGTFTHFFSLESDVVVPYNTIEHLIGLDKDVVSLPYFHGNKTNPFILNGSTLEVNGVKMGFEQDTLENYLYINGTVREAFQCGIGCMMLRRHVIEKIPFRLDRQSYDIGYPDAYLHDDLAKAKIPVFLDTRILSIEHYNNYENWAKIFKGES